MESKFYRYLHADGTAVMVWQCGCRGPSGASRPARSWSRRPRRALSRRGFHASSVDEVAERAGYTKGAVYSNFASKEDLFFAVYQRRVEQALTEVVPGPAPGRRGTGV